MFKTIILICTLLSQPAHAWWLFSDNDDYLMERHTTYSLEQCQQYNDPSEDPQESEYVLACERGQLEALPIQDEDEVSRLLKGITLLEKDNFENFMMRDFKKFVLQKLEGNFELLAQDNQCFSEGAPGSCQSKVQSMTQAVRNHYPEMRINLSLSHRPGVYFGIEPSLNNQNYLNIIRRDIEHPYHDNDIPKLSDEEARATIKTHWQQQGDAIRDYFTESNVPLKCQTINPNTEQPILKISEKECRDQHQFGATKAMTDREYEERDSRFKTGYSNLVGQFPFMPYMKLGDLSNVSDQQLQADMKQAYQRITDETHTRIQEMKNWPLDEFKDLFRYKGLLEQYLKEKNPPPQFLCDIVEDVHEWHGEGGWWSIAGDVGIGAAALLGGGICYFTAGIGCAVGVAVVTEAVALTRQGVIAHETLQDVRVNLAQDNNADTAILDLKFAAAFAPLSFVGLEAGRGLRPAARSIANAVKQVKADVDQLGNFLMRLSSRAKDNLVKARNIFGQTDVSAVLALSSRLNPQMQAKVLKLLDDPNMIDSQAFQELLYKARQLATAQCLERGSV